jgi:8-oxo-dGTP pyrophosphatase MutT (NUDIX family)
MSDVIRAAGGIPWRRLDDERLEILLVHRPQYDDWTFPKGKNDEGESDEDAARREVEEETGLRVHLGPELPASEYIVKGQPKRVRYWVLSPENPDDAQPQHEIDELAWLDPDAAADRLSYERDRELLAYFLELVS